MDGLHLFLRNSRAPSSRPARIDGATPSGARALACPAADDPPGSLFDRAAPGLILSWNEAFWSLNLTSVNAAPLPVFIASYSSPEGLFWAKLSAASFLAVAPIMVLGWMTQKQTGARIDLWSGQIESKAYEGNGPAVHIKNLVKDVS